ncbi:helix-turn-helix domain-containing protein [Ferruginibacter albus]|uniref:helix-turn-helix domain-containing protein n=1 Tax=Ferruginibacter albus TaxID=2875540 RepID=UPI001CC560C2|nr:helix-turn-helix transcriptional regulator [Ferruginibacter albus]UAY52733.1 helix-turn-helix transcriptional regulator [Ferruginibacter albus]
MIKNKKKLIPEETQEFLTTIDEMELASKIFVDKSLEIAEYIFLLLEEKGMKQKELADAMGKTEAEISKWLGGLHNYTLRSISKIEAALGTSIICTPHHRSYDVLMTNKQSGQIQEAIIPSSKFKYPKECKILNIRNYQNCIETKQIDSIKQDYATAS